MAVAVADAEQVLDDTGDSYTVPSEPSPNPLLLGFFLASDDSASAGTLTFTIGGQAFGAASSISANGGSSPYIHSAYGRSINGDTWPSTGAQTVVCTSSTTFANEGICIVSLTGVDQTTPIKSFESDKGESLAQFPTMTLTAANGDMVYWIGTTDTARTISSPTQPGTDAWTGVATNVSTIVSGGLSKGSIYRMAVTETITEQSINGGLDTTAASAGCSMIVIGGAAAAANTRRYGMPLLGVS